ncbi:hypothetical protein PHPALM_30816 [Phytophthora palmivora]|uniref:Uncharacterized protein n=1 Tax=Phytophthora palmivora TaxID=4796 RepID=A0A2P4X467_9STRA|nr:hypothetical protein PHPALM_30816 [Phytophthora palmivora]
MLRLQEKYKDQDLLVYIPSEVQIKNRKAHLTRQLEKQTKTTTFAELNEWASLRMCTSRETFFDGHGFDAATDEATFSALPAGHRNGTLVLNTFYHDYQDDNVKKTSFGLIMTSRRIFRNVRNAAEGQQSDDIFAAADGTYKLHFGNWVLVAFGTYRSQYTTAREYSKSFVPHA